MVLVMKIGQCLGQQNGFASCQSPKRHKYAASGKSLIEPLFVPWWNFAITLCPLWIAPNMITFLGFLVNLQAFLIGIGFESLLLNEFPIIQ